jgi:hypothetical protein
LPDGIFSNQKSRFGQILEGLAMEDVGVFYVHLVYFMAIWYILWPFGIFYACFKYIPRFGELYQEKSGIPGESPSSDCEVNLHPIQLNFQREL